MVRGALFRLSPTIHQWCRFSRNIAQVTPKIICFCYLKKYFQDQSIKKKYLNSFWKQLSCRSSAGAGVWFEAGRLHPCAWRCPCLQQSRGCFGWAVTEQSSTVSHASYKPGQKGYRLFHDGRSRAPGLRTTQENRNEDGSLTTKAGQKCELYIHCFAGKWPRACILMWHTQVLVDIEILRHSLHACLARETLC